MNQNYLIIDIGNTNQKIAVYSHDEQLLFLQQVPLLNQDIFKKMLADFNIQSAIVSSVGHDNVELFQWLSKQIQLLTFSSSLKLPIELRYATPHTLGTDRIANAVGANALFPNQNVLSIQAGSCLVADFINSENQYLGGSIAPGLRMRFQALAHFTAKLPLVENQPIDFLIGNSTNQSILSGVINGMAGEIDSLIRNYQEQYIPLKAVLTGGDALQLEDMLKNAIFAAPNLVLYGLFKILKLNATEI